MINLNLYFFQKINGPSGKNRWLDAFGRAGAEFVIVGMLGWFLVCVWLAGNFDFQFAVQSIEVLVVAGLAGWALNWILALVIHEPRPFLNVPQDHEMFRPFFPSLFKWKSFPSDHTMFSFTIFFTALILHLPLAWPLLFLALWVGWGRVYAGVHYPGDIVGGFAVAMAVAAVINCLLASL